MRAIRRSDQNQSMEAVNRLVDVLDNTWLIAVVSLLVTAFGVMHTLTATPLYEADTVIQIKRSAEFTNDFRAENNVMTEMEVLKSRSILAPVVNRLQLDVTLDPAPPTFISSVHRMLGRDQLASGDVSSLTPVRIAHLDLPAALLTLPLTMTMKAKGAFHLASDELGIGVDGIAGTPVRMDSRYGPIDIDIRASAAAPGTRFILRRVSAAQATEQLQRALVVTENAKQSNVIRLTLQGSNQELISRILGAIVAEYRHRRSAEQQSEAAGLAAAYDQQLTESKAAVQMVDNQYSRVLQQSGISDPEAEAQLLMQRSSALEIQLANAQQRSAELSARIGDGHPEMQALRRQIADIGRVLSRNAARYESLAATARKLAQVRSEKLALNEAALALGNQRSKLGAVTSTERDDVRVLEPPSPSLSPVTLGKSTMLILSCCAGISAGLFASFIKNFYLQRRRILRLTQRNTRFRLISQGRTS